MRGILAWLGRSRVVTTVLVLLILLAGVYLFRWPLIGGTIRATAAGALADSLGIRVEIGELSGSLLTGFRCATFDAVACDDRARVRSFSLSGLDVACNPWKLLKGDLSALFVTAAAASARIDLDRPGIPSPNDPPPATTLTLPRELPSFDLPLDSLVLLQGGRSAHIEGCRLRLAGPGPTDCQPGSVTADRVRLTVPEREEGETWTVVRLPCSYSAGRIVVGPLTAGDEAGILKAEADVGELNSGRIGIRLAANLFGGDISLRAETALGQEMPFDASLELEGIDLARLDDAIATFAGPAGRLSLKGSLRAGLAITGSLLDRGSIGIGGDCSLEDGAFLDFSGVGVALKADLKGDCLNLEHCSVTTEMSRITTAEGRLPFRRDFPVQDGGSGWIYGGRPRFAEAALSFSIDLDGSDHWLGAAGVTPETWPDLEKTRAQASGSYSGGTFSVETLNLASPSRNFVVRDGFVALGGEGVRVGIGVLSGNAEGVDLSLSRPLDVGFLHDRVIVEPACIKAGPCTVELGGEIPHEGPARLQAAVNDLDRDFLASLLPSGVLPDDLDWKGLTVHLQLDGPADAAGDDGEWGGSVPGFLREGRIAFSLRTLDVAGVGLDAVKFEARISPVSRDPESEVQRRAALPFRLDVETVEAAIRSGGSVKGGMQWRGSLDDPECALSLRLDVKEIPVWISDGLPLSDGPPGPIDLDLELRLADGYLMVDRMVLMSRLGALDASGRLPLTGGIAFEAAQPFFDRERPLVADIDLSRFDLAPFELAPGLQGIAGATLHFAGSLASPEALFSAGIEEVVCPPLEPHLLTIAGRLGENVLWIDRLDVETAEGENVVAGTVSVKLIGPGDGIYSLPGPDSEIAADLCFSKRPFDSYAAAFGSSVRGGGAVRIKGAGTLAEPVYDVEIDMEGIADDRMGEMSLPSLTVHGRMTFEADTLRVHDLRLCAADGDCLTGAGRVPVGVAWDRLARGSVFDRHGGMEALVESSDLDLSRFSGFIPGLRGLSGVLSVTADLAGTPAEPVCRGRLDVTDGSLRFEGDLPSIEELKVAVEADDRGVHIIGIDGLLGGGPLHVEGRVPFSDMRPDSFDLRITGDHVLLVRGGGLRVRADCDVAVTGPFGSPLVSGEVGLVDTRYVRRIPLFSGKAPPRVNQGIRPFSLTDPFGGNILFDLSIVTVEEDSVFVNNNLALGAIHVDLALKGTGRDPWFRGDVVFNSMLIKLPNSRFRTDTGRLTFSEHNPYDPQIAVTAHSRRQSYDIEAIARGPLSSPEITLSSSPPLDSDSLLVLVTTGILPETVQANGMGNEALQQVGAYLGQELIHEFFGSETTESGESLGDRFELSVGTEVGTDGTNNIVLEYRMKEDWYLQAERDIYGDANFGVLYRIRF
jgi:hypothetical protein